MRKSIEYNSIRLYERSAADVLSIAAIDDLNILEVSIMTIRDSVKYNFRWYNPKTWVLVNRFSLKNLYNLPKREIFEMAKAITELEMGETDIFRFILKEMDEKESAKYLEDLKKKAMTAMKSAQM